MINTLYKVGYCCCCRIRCSNCTCCRTSNFNPCITADGSVCINTDAGKVCRISGPAGFIFSSPLLSNTRIDSLFQGVYDVELTVKDNLGAIAKDTVTITVSAPRLSNISSNEFKVYPNPVRDIATLEINTLNTHTNLSVSIFDESGKLVLYNEFVTATSYTQRKLNMTSFSNGFYILNVRFDDGKMYSKRIFKYGER